MKPYRKWLLVLLLAWLLLFLSLLCHFLDLRSSRLPWSGLSRTETHHLASSEKDWRSRRTDFRSRSEDYYRSRSLEILQRLWTGNLTVEMLSPRLQKVLKVQLSSNRHQVTYQGPRRDCRSGLQLYCELKRRTRIRTVDGTQEPFSGLGWARLVPSLPLQQIRASRYQSCAVVTSAGAILNSSLGREIDSHDAVLRFNAAPTKGFERDVGTKTTIRIINSQIVARPKHQFNSSSLYQDVTLLLWDPAPYSSNLTEWFEKPDFDLFSAYVERRRLRPEQPFYILHPEFIWSLWDLIQDNTGVQIQPNPPSSGFTGILLMMSLCGEVSVYEFIPSVRRTDRCHYYERYHDAACTLGAYHPLLYEKLLIQRINVGPQDQLRTKGKVTLRGFRTVRCGS
ncbi:beta-galactoside alpha-2,6-sialyltransferase 2-like [Acanthopagrus latus]|uniref:beta-galactoside alpha-2,6-sialyltransferase 2-like n=1 Tax=Acanthopagrus latus TaxID=8177 RepID=UPI00187BF64B|nr:beta-galactoside alpha-2,6-sialyltransferase 2-like [Acanthopagrus latus]